jgi:serine/threonine protein kinase
MYTTTISRFISGPLPYGQFRFEYASSTPVGQGGFGSVFRVRVVKSSCPQHPVGKVLAAKRLNARWAENPEAQKRFDREIAAMSRMSHASIVKCVGQNLAGGERFYVMDFYSDNMRQLVRRNRLGTNWRVVANHGAHLADALHYAHSLGNVHRDLKPENILFNPGGHLVISDWGIGHFVHRESVVLVQLTRAGIGTEYYCSMEQWMTGAADARGDVYSLGMTLDEWAIGGQRTNVRIGGGVTGPATSDRSAGGRHFNAAIAAMTRPQRAARLHSMAAVAAEMRRALSL